MFADCTPVAKCIKTIRINLMSKLKKKNSTILFVYSSNLIQDIVIL